MGPKSGPDTVNIEVDVAGSTIACDLATGISSGLSADRHATRSARSELGRAGRGVVFGEHDPPGQNAERSIGAGVREGQIEIGVRRQPVQGSQ